MAVFSLAFGSKLFFFVQRLQHHPSISIKYLEANQRSCMFLKVRIVLALLFAMLASMLVRDIISYDTWWHLKLGQQIFEYRAVPKLEMFSYPLQGRDWVDIHWLYQLLLFSVFNFVAGATGLVLLKTILFLLTFLILTRINIQESYPAAIVVGFVLAASASYERFVVRPEMFSALFLAAFIFVLSRFKQSGCKSIWLLPLIQVLWVNMQGLFVLGPIIMVFFVIGELFLTTRLLFFPATREQKLPNDNVKTSMIILGLIIFACFVNPYAYKGATYPLQFFQFFGTKEAHGFSTTIMEFVSPFKRLYYSESIYWYMGMLILSMFVILTRLYIFPSWYLLTYGFFLILSVLARRNILFFAIAAFPLTTIGLDNIIKHIRKDRSWKQPLLVMCERITSALLISLVLAIACDHFFRYYERRHGFEIGYLGVRQNFLPKDAADFILRNNITGNIFNDIGSGGYLLYRLYPKRKVFIDGRNTDESFFRQFLQATANYTYFKELSVKYDFNYVLVESRAPYLKQLATNLTNDMSWTQVYFDPGYQIFIKNTAKNQNMILRAAKNFVSSKVKSNLDRGYLYSQLGFTPLALQAYLAEIKANPQSGRAYANSAAILAGIGQLEQAEKFYRVAYDLSPLDHLVLLSLADFYEKTSRKEKALLLYQKILEIKPGFEPARKKIAQLNR